MSNNEYLNEIDEKILTVQFSLTEYIKAESTRVALIFDAVNGRLRLAEKSIDSITSIKISEDEIVRHEIRSKHHYLYEYGWMITPYLRGKAISEVLLSAKDQNLDGIGINNLFQNFFQKENYKELESMINTWQTNQLYSKRMDIFRSCVNLLKNNGLDDAICIIIIPVLIAQIDGFLLDYARQKKGYGMKKSSIIDNVTRKMFSGHSAWMGELTVDNIPIIDKVDIYAYNFLVDYLFAKAYPLGQIDLDDKQYEQPKSIEQSVCYNRHKIMHGEDLSYGTLGNLLRTFLLVDYLASFKLN